MKRVKIYSYVDGEQKLSAVCQTDEDGVLTISGEDAVLISYLKKGIDDYSVTPKGVVMPEEGDKFLEQLHLNFRTIYTSATKPEKI